jgi:hypothetical protein
MGIGQKLPPTVRFFSAAVLGKRPNGPEKFMNYCGFILRKGPAGYGAEHGPDRSVTIALADQFLRSHPSCL